MFLYNDGVYGEVEYRYGVFADWCTRVEAKQTEKQNRNWLFSVWQFSPAAGLLLPVHMKILT